MTNRKNVNISYNQETRLALLEMSVLNIANTLNEMRKDTKEELKSIRYDFKEEIKEVKNNTPYNFKWLHR